MWNDWIEVVSQSQAQGVLKRYDALTETRRIPDYYMPDRKIIYRSMISFISVDFTKQSCHQVR